MLSISRSKRPRRRPRRSELRLGKTYEQAVTQKRLPVQPIARSRSRIVPRVASLLLSLGLLGALSYLFLSDAFYVFDATVVGAALVSPEEVFQQTEMQGYSVFFIDPRQAEERVTALPDVREATVWLSLPNEMVIEVGERQARLVWLTGEQRYGVDQDGLIVSLQGDVEPNIMIRDLDSAPRQLGEQLDIQTVSAAETYQALLTEVREFEYSREHGLSYRNEHGWRVYLGDGTGAELKVAVVDALVQRLANRGETVDFIDVRFPESPLYRLAEASEPAPQ